MKTGEATQLREGRQAMTPEIVYGERIGDLASKIHDAIAHRAYEFFEARGYQDGRDLEDWFRAESELLHPANVKTWESEKEVHVTAEIPAFKAGEVQIGVEPGRVIIWANSGLGSGRTVGYPDRFLVALYHTLDLPAAVDPSKASGRLADGLLKLELLKIIP